MTVCSITLSKVKVKVYLFLHLERGLGNDHGFLNLGTIPTAYRDRIFDFCPSFSVT